MPDIIPIPALRDNYIWLLKNAKHGVVVDPGDAKPVLDTLEKLKLQLTGILITHHHWDHTNGIAELLQHYDVPVYAPANDAVELATELLQQDDQIHLPELDLNFRVLEIPGHTLGHIAYYGHSSVFCGDTLFTGGCGRLFEGTAEQMVNSLNTLANLPEDTFVYCGHEYTQNNLRFAKVVEPNNPNLIERIEATEKHRQQNQPTVPAPLAIELKTNPFLRCTVPSVQKAVVNHCGHKLTNTTEVFAELRRWKDEF